jgi:hypothetical protein
MSYSPVARELLRSAAGSADKILKGAKPADLPVEQWTDFQRCSSQIARIDPSFELMRQWKALTQQTMQACCLYYASNISQAEPSRRDTNLLIKTASRARGFLRS